MPGGPTTDELRAQLASRDCKAVTEAAEALVRMGVHFDEQDLAPLRRCLQAHGIGTRMRLARAYIALLTPARAPAAGVRLVEQTPNLEFFEDLGPSALGVLAPLLEDPDRMIRWRACEAIRHIGGSSAMPLLVHALEDDAFSVRWTASHGLIEAGPAAVVPLLEALVTRPATLTFHQAARRILRRWHTPEAEAERLALVDSLARETTTVESGWLALRLLRRLRARQAVLGGAGAADKRSRGRVASFPPAKPQPAGG